MSHMLILYFSNTGNTEKIAKLIANKTGGDLYRVLPETPYSSKDLDWNIPNSRANLEQNDQASRPPYQGQLPDLGEYDTIIIGHPIWWGAPPRIIYTVIDDLNFSGKQVATYATSGGSTYSQSQDVMDALIGKDVKRGQVLSGAASVDNWLKMIN